MVLRCLRNELEVLSKADDDDPARGNGHSEPSSGHGRPSMEVEDSNSHSNAQNIWDGKTWTSGDIMNELQKLGPHVRVGGVISCYTHGWNPSPGKP